MNTPPSNTLYQLQVMEEIQQERQALLASSSGGKGGDAVPAAAAAAAAACAAAAAGRGGGATEVIVIDDDDDSQQPEGQPADAPERGGGPGKPVAVQQEAAVAPVLVVCQDTFTAGQVRCGWGRHTSIQCKHGHALQGCTAWSLWSKYTHQLPAAT